MGWVTEEQGSLPSGVRKGKPASLKKLKERLSNEGKCSEWYRARLREAFCATGRVPVFTSRVKRCPGRLAGERQREHQTCVLQGTH